jgi:hypothetical protein
MDCWRKIEAAPHGVELLDMQNSLAGDIVAAGRAELVVIFREAIEEICARSGAISRHRTDARAWPKCCSTRSTA